MQNHNDFGPQRSYKASLNFHILRQAFSLGKPSHCSYGVNWGIRRSGNKILVPANFSQGGLKANDFGCHDQPRRMGPLKKTMHPVTAEFNKNWVEASMEVICILEWAGKKKKGTCNQARLLKSWINVSFQDNKAGKETKPENSSLFSALNTTNCSTQKYEEKIGCILDLFLNLLQQEEHVPYTACGKCLRMTFCTSAIFFWVSSSLILSPHEFTSLESV